MNHHRRLCTWSSTQTYGGNKRRGPSLTLFKWPLACWQYRDDCDRCVDARVSLRGRFRTPRRRRKPFISNRPLWRGNSFIVEKRTGAYHAGPPLRWGILSRLFRSPLILPTPRPDVTLPRAQKHECTNSFVFTDASGVPVRSIISYGR